MQKNRLKLIFMGALLALTSLASAAGRVNAPSETKINPDVNWGTWDGWGTSLCWMGNVFGDRDDIADVLFTTKTVSLGKESLPGLGLNIARYNLGACSKNTIEERKNFFSTTTKKMGVSKTIRPVRQIDGYWLDGKSEDPNSTSWDWSVDAKQRAMLLKARDRGANWFELFSNSPMWWMCKSLNPSGAVRGKDNNLEPEHYKDFAIYMATVAKQAKDKWGITFTSVEPFNEPSVGCWSVDFRQEGCHFDPRTHSPIIKLLRAELDKRGLKEMPVAASDETHYDMAVATWNTLDTDAKRAVGQYNVHGYQGTRGRPDFVYQQAQESGKRLWDTECGNPEPTGLQIASWLNREFHYLHPTAWCYWQPLDTNNWGLINSDLSSKTIGSANPKYYVLAQYSRHIRQGMTILDTDEKDTVAAYDAKQEKLVIIALNNKKQSDSRVFDLSAFAVTNGPVKRWITVPHGVSRYAAYQDISLTNKHFECPFPENSIQTFEIENVKLLK